MYRAVMVTDAEVESKINQVLSQNPKIEEVDRPAAEGDIVNIDYVGNRTAWNLQAAPAKDRT